MMTRGRWMRAGFGKLGMALALSAQLALAACASSGKPPVLMNLRASAGGPDEFAILPTKPLQMPPSMASLPEPTPGGANLTDPTPAADAIAALGGNPAVLARGSAAAEAGLLSYASRFGTSADIRSALAAEDLQFRRDNDGRLLERLFNVNVYFRAYLPMSLDQAAELERWRRAGVRTVGAPPEPALLNN
jgi:hypothetical protein